MSNINVVMYYLPTKFSDAFLQ